MILAALNEYYARLRDADSEESGGEAELLAPPGFSVQKIAFVVVLEPDGRLPQIDDYRMPDPNDWKGKRMAPRPRIVPGESTPSGSGVNPRFLWGNTGYVLGHKPDDPKPARTRQTFEAFRKYHLDQEQAVGDPAFSAVCRFLERWAPEQAVEHPILAELATGFGVFRLRGQTQFIHERPAVRNYWLRQSGQEEGDGVVVGQCLVTGTRGPVARIHEPKIKGVLGAQSSGATLVSFNFDAVKSYGKEQSYNAPVGEEAAFRYANALNHLLRMGSRQRVQVGDATTVFWTAQPSPAEAVVGVVFQPPPEDEEQKKEVEALLLRIARGANPGELGDPETAFYVLGLSGNAARLSVRFWHVSTVGDVLDKLRRHFQDLSLEGKAPWEPEFPSLQDILDQTARERKDVPDVLGGAIMRAVLGGTNYPDALYLAVLRRIRADRRITHTRAAILKAYLNRNHRKEVPVSLDPNRLETAYHLGRLFAALERVQERAFWDPNTKRITIKDTIRDRYFGAASATPRSVFPRLIRLKQHHLGKIENPRHRLFYEKRIQEIVDRIRDFPSHLNLEDQGLFDIGYYHQRKAFFPAHRGRNAEGTKEN